MNRKMARTAQSALSLLAVSCLCFALCGCNQFKTAFGILEAESAYNRGNFGKAVKIYQGLIEINPQSADLHWHLGLAYFSAGNYDKVLVQIKHLKALKAQKLADDLQQLLDKE